MSVQIKIKNWETAKTKKEWCVDIIIWILLRQRRNGVWILLFGYKKIKNKLIKKRDKHKSHPKRNQAKNQLAVFCEF